MRSPFAIKLLLEYQEYGQALGEESQALWNRYEKYVVDIKIRRAEILCPD